MSVDKMKQNDDEEKKLNAIMAEDKKVSNSDEKADGGGSGEGNKDEDDDQNFIKKDDPEEKREEVFQDIKSDLDSTVQDLEAAQNGVRPEGNQQRNLDRETGGLESEQDMGVSEKDAWDDRGEQISETIHGGEDLNNASKSSRAQGFIHVAKQKNLQAKHNEAAGATLSHVAKLMQWRKNTETNKGQEGGGPLI